MKSEAEIYNYWEKEKLFTANPSSPKKPYSLLIPPPNLTGELHIGHAMQHSILDAVARFKRLQGFDVLLLPGVDHAGIAFETTFDKELKKNNLSKEKLGREKWTKRAWKFKEKVYKELSSNWRMLGLSADWKREVFSLDQKRQKAVFEEFKIYFEKGLVYRGPYIVQWCPKCKTAIEDAEVEYQEKKEKLFYVRYLIEKENNKFIEVATTRPETIFADTGIAIYPNHPKYKKLVGKKAHVPLPNKKGRLIPILEDKRVDKDFGTGALKITPGHDLLDYEIGKDHKLPIISVVDKNGQMINTTADLNGLTAGQAREKSLKILSKNGALSKSKNYKHSIAVCERCKSTVEPIISEEWFIKINKLAKGAIKILKEKRIKFLPPHYGKILISWLENIHDWCISRSLWWGHRIPIWYKGKEMKVSHNSPGAGWQQDKQVLDTWFSSGLWPLSTLGWPNIKSKAKSQKLEVNKENSLFDRYFPWDFEISAPEIKFLWIARMIMIASFLTQKPPFKTMFFHGMLRDLQGRKFSKSLGNGIEPTYLIERWGTDATRMTLYSYSIPGRDGRVSKEILDERGKNFRNFATKIRNIARFTLDLRPQGSDLIPLQFKHKDDQWIKTHLDKTTQEITKSIESLKLHLATDKIYEFVWHKFADIYIEKSKKRRVEAQPVLEHVLKTTLILLHPFMPFTTEEIYQKFKKRKKSIMLECWPSSNEAPLQ